MTAAHRTRQVALLSLAVALVIALACVPSAFGAYTRPFLGQITGTPTGPEGAEVPFGLFGESPLAPTIDAEGNLWVANLSKTNGFIEVELYKLDSTGHLLVAHQLENPPSSMAYGDSAGRLYAASLTSTQVVVETFDDEGNFVANGFPAFPSHINITVDNSTDPLDPSAGDVYISVENGSGIERFSPSGEELSAVVSGEYGQMAVAATGDLYAVNHSSNAVDEFSPTGARLRAIGLKEAPQIEGGQGHLESVAVDPTSGNVVTAVGTANAAAAAVDEFDSAGGFVTQIRQVVPSAAPTACGLPRASFLRSAAYVAVGPQGDVYVDDDGRETREEACENALDVYGPGRYVPSLRLDQPGSLSPTSATLRGAVNPEGQPLAQCAFEYVTEAAFSATGFSDLSSGGSVPCVPGPGGISGSAYTEVHADLSGLTSGQVYRYRLLATSSGALGGTSESETLAFTAPHAPSVDATSVANISSTFADLHARIDPRGADTSYYFEYVDVEHYEPGAADPYASGARAPLPAADIGSGGANGSTDASVAQQVAGLVPGVTYHVRVVASNAAGVTFGPNLVFTALAAPLAGLPDHRAYELVTPVNKGGSPDMFGTVQTFYNLDTGYASQSGEEFLMTNTLATFGSAAASQNNAYLFTRGAGGWQATSLAAPTLGVQSMGTHLVFDPGDFSRVAFEELVGSASSPEGWRRTSLVGAPGGPYATLRTDFSGHGSRSEEEEEEITEATMPVGASHDLGRVVLESLSHALAPGDKNQVPHSTALYEWSGGPECGLEESSCTLVNVGSEDALLNRCGAVLGQGKISGTKRNAVSADGSRLLFTAPDPYAANDGPGCWNGGPYNGGAKVPATPVNAPQLYLRSGETTLELSTPESGVSEEGHAPLAYPAMYVGASEDDSRIFFLTQTKLTKDAPSQRDVELYECEIVQQAGEPTCRLTRISAGESGEAAAGVQTVPAVSADGSAVYFTALESLTAVAPTVENGQVDLYRYDTRTGRTVFIATIDSGDYSQGGISTQQWGLGEIALSETQNWYTTPDGRFLLFATARELTGYSTAEASPGDCPASSSTGNSELPGHCTEIYRYDSSDGSIACVSCDPSDTAPSSNAQFASHSAPTTPAGGTVRAMSDDGAYVFFDTADPLVPLDSNGTLDVYEWHEGRVALISSGVDSAPSFFLGASADGTNVFFGTHARLVPQDTDTNGDLYDARIDGGFGAGIQDVGPCEGDACQHPPATPIDATPASASFSGAGNLTAETPSLKHAVKTKAKPARAKRLLAKALRACTKKRGHGRKRCEARARRLYGKAALNAGVRRQTSSNGRAGR